MKLQILRKFGSWLLSILSGLMLRRILRILMGIILCIVLMGGACVLVAESWTYFSTADACHDTPQECTSSQAVGLVLGCSKFLDLKRTRRNYYFKGRMEAAAELWKSGKVRCIIVSGDNRSDDYNEPADMEADLVKLGVPRDKIVRDHAGLCTYDSVYRAKYIFGADKLIIVSQKEHVSRAVTIANHLNIEAEGLNAPLIPITNSAKLRAWVRERAARVSMVYDLLSDRVPEHMGAPISLPK